MHSNPRVSRTTLIVGIFIVTACVTLGAMIGCVYNSIESEKNLLALRCVDAALSDYIAANGEWPSRWEVLSCNYTKHYNLPRDVKEVSQRVFLAFPGEGICKYSVEDLVHSNGRVYEIEGTLSKSSKAIDTLCDRPQE